MKEDRSARQIYQSLLDRLTAGILANNADLIVQAICLPFRARTPNGEITYKDTKTLRMGMTLYSRTYVNDGVTGMERRCDLARFLAEDQIVGHHWTRGWRDDDSEMKPFASRMHLFRVDGDWKLGIMTTAAKPSNWKELAAASEGIETDPSSLRRIDSEEPDLNVLQSVLDWASTAFMADDARGWISIAEQPLTLIRGDNPEVFDTDDLLRADFRHYRALFEMHGVTDILRIAHEARRLSADEMEGTYTTYILCGANPILPPWKARMILRRQRDGFWRISRVENALSKSLSVLPPPTEKSPEEAAKISNRMLAQTGKALLTGDFDLFAACFHLPHDITTMNEKLHFETRNDLRLAFERMSAAYRADSIDDLHRYVIAAEFKTPDRIASTHMTHLMRGGEETEEAFPVFSIIEHRNGHWGVAQSEYALAADSPRGAALRSGDPTRRTPEAASGDPATGADRTIQKRNTDR